MKVTSLRAHSRNLLIGTTSLLAAGSIFAGSYTVSIPENVFYPLAWSFQNTTVSNAFPAPGYDVSIYIFDVGIQGYQVCSYDTFFSSWDTPNAVLANGTGFYYRHSVANGTNVTVQGTDLTSSSVTFNFSANTSYFLGSAYLQPTSAVNAIECVFNPGTGTYPYTTESLNYHSNMGDVVLTWHDSLMDWGGGVRATNCSIDAGEPHWENVNSSCSWYPGTHLSPQVQRGMGFWLTPSTNTNWTQYPTQPSCPN
jgi:hypothetical protein